MARNIGRSLSSNIRTTLGLNPIWVLLVLAVASLLVAIFYFGSGETHQDPNLSDLFRTLGIGALAAAVTGLVDHYLLFKNFEPRIRESHLEAMGIAAALRTLGIQNAYKPYDFGRPFVEAEPGETVSWLDTYCPRADDFLNDLQTAIARNVTVRMLVIVPGCENARRRSIELTGQPDSGRVFDLALETFIAKMDGIAKESSRRLEIRHYDDLPCIPMYLIGKPNHPRKAFFSIFLSKATAQCTHLEISNGEWLENMGTYFEKKWERFAPKAPGARHKEK